MTESPKKDPQNSPSEPLPDSVKNKPATKRRGNPQNLTRAGLGRPKGSVNKTGASVRTAIIEAFHKAGGVEYLVNLAAKDARAFATLLAKILPQDVRIDGEVRHSALFSPEQLRRMADAQEQGTIDITDTATITYPESMGGQDGKVEETQGVWPGPADPEFPGGTPGYTLNGETDLGSHPPRHSDD